MNLDHDEFDTGLAELFEQDRRPLDEPAFISATLARLQRARRARTLRHLTALILFLGTSAGLAPYVASASLASAQWLAGVTSRPAATGSVSATVFWIFTAWAFWRVARRAWWPNH